MRPFLLRELWNLDGLCRLLAMGLFRDVNQHKFQARG
jgi:hypothetical protein